MREFIAAIRDAAAAGNDFYVTSARVAPAGLSHSQTRMYLETLDDAVDAPRVLEVFDAIYAAAAGGRVLDLR